GDAARASSSRRAGPDRGRRLSRRDDQRRRRQPRSGQRLRLQPDPRRQRDRQLRARGAAGSGQDPPSWQPLTRAPGTRPVGAGRDRARPLMTIALARQAQDRGRAPGWLLIGGIVLASLTEAIGGTALSLSAGDIMGDIHATPDEFAWLDIGYTAAKLTGFALTPWLLARVRPCRALLAATLATGAAGGLAAFTATFALFILLRAIQGSAGAVL